MKALIGTKNPGKIEGATKALSHFFDDVEVIGVPVSSDVSDQPVNSDIYLGALNRVDNLIKYASDNNVDADYFLGIESGITNSLGKWVIINIAVIKDRYGYESFGTSSSLPIPDKYVDEIIKTDFGKVMDRVLTETNLGSGKGGISC